MRTSCISTITSFCILSIFEMDSIRSQEVHFTPVVSIENNSVSGCRPHSISFNNNGAPNLSYTWDFKDGSPVSHAFSPKHVFLKSGIFNVEMIAYDSHADFRDTTITTITVFPVPRCEFVIVDKAYCQRIDSIHFVNVSIGASLLHWTINGENFPGEKLQFMPDTSGTYAISLVAENTFGCRDSTARKIEVVPSPLAISKR